MISLIRWKSGLDTVNRVAEVSKTAGGKGLNVTRVLAEIGDHVAATGLIGGTNGKFLLQNLHQNVQQSFYEISGIPGIVSPFCTRVQANGNPEAGPRISASEANGFLHHFKHLMESADVVSISGSLPAGLPVEYYIQLIEIANQFDNKVVLDCSGAALEAVLKSNVKPTAIKPNNEELSQLLGREVSKDIGELKSVLSDPLFEGVEWIIVSLGADGAFAKHWDTFYKVDIPKIEVVNPVGSGDSTVAGISFSSESS